MKDRPTDPRPNQARGQFLRIEKYAQIAPHGKQGLNTIFKVANEAIRADGFCPHVANPEIPKILFGVDPVESAELAKAWAHQQPALFLHKPTQTLLSRKFRADKPCALVGVISLPPEWTTGPRWDQFCQQCISWLKIKFGEDRLTSVLSHLDEVCLHLHFWVIPRPDENFSSIHQGEKAIDKVGRNSARLIRDAAYKKAMAELLDEFNMSVGRRFGLDRQTVNGSRYSRAQWLHKQYLDRQREIAVQKRINAAIEITLANAAIDQSRRVDSDAALDCALTPKAQCAPVTSVGLDQLRAGSEIEPNLIGSRLKLPLRNQRVLAPLTVTPPRVGIEILNSNLSTAQWIRPRSR